MKRYEEEMNRRLLHQLEQERRAMENGEMGEAVLKLKTQIEAERKPNPGLVRVFKIPAPTDGYCFDPKPAIFLEVDWFRDDRGMMESESGRSEIREFIEKKIYAKDGTALLVMSPVAAFTIDYTAAKNPPPVQR